MSANNEITNEPACTNCASCQSTEQPTEQLPERTLVDDVLETDAKYRDPELAVGEAGLITIDKLDFTKEWDLSLPTLMPGHRYYWHRKTYATSTEAYMEKLYDERGYPVMKDILTWNEKSQPQHGIGVCMAGGAAERFMHNRYRDTNADVDLFFYRAGDGPKSAEQLTNVLGEFMKHIYTCMNKFMRELRSKSIEKLKQTCVAQYGKAYDSLSAAEKSKWGEIGTSWSVDAVRSPHALTLYIHHDDFYYRPQRTTIKLQVIFRLYNGISELLHGFDIGPGAIAFTGQDVYMTNLAKFCYEHKAMILDTTRRSTSYETRLIKYMKRGFALILPDLNMASVNTKNTKYKVDDVLDLKMFPVSYSNVEGNCIHVRKYLGKPGVKSDYEGYVTKDNATDRNIISLLHEEWQNCWFFQTHSYARDTEILRQNPIKLRRAIEHSYSCLKYTMVSTGQFNYADYRKYIRWQPLMTTLEQFFGDNEENEKGFAYKTRTGVYAYAVMEEKRVQLIRDIIDKQKEICLERFDERLKTYPTEIQWITENAGTQVSGSFNPVMEDPVEWYGEDHYQPVINTGDTK